jgi:excisionase family DNA binding protein
MLNTAEAARFLRVSEASIRRWADSGRLKAGRVGGRRERRFKESDLLAFMAGPGPDASELTVGAARLPVPAHIATYYTTDQGGLRLTVPFLADGLRLGQPCVLVASEPMASRYRNALGRPEDGSLEIVVFEGGTVAAALTEWERRLGELVSGGAGLVRIVGEMSCERDMFESEEEMLRYEEAFELVSKRYPIAVICQYDARAFSGTTIVRALKAHPDMFAFRIGTFLN